MLNAKYHRLLTAVMHYKALHMMKINVGITSRALSWNPGRIAITSFCDLYLEGQKLSFLQKLGWITCGVCASMGVLGCRKRHIV